MGNLEQLEGKRVHFVGIGGSGMSGIARIMLSEGLQVSGSDLTDSLATQSLSALGAQIYIGQSKDNIEGVDVLITSGAIAPTNPELLAARERGVRILTRSEALALLMAGKRSIAVAGTHGKTTTTSMLTVALQAAGLDPSFAIGGLINSSGVNAHLGTGDIFVAEADESDGSFTAYHPLGAIITNIELDHVDHFNSIEEIYRVFVEFVETIQTGGFVIACNDDQGVLELLQRITRQDISIITYGRENADFKITNIHLEPSSSFARLVKRGMVLPELHLTIPGAHNVMNAVAAFAAADCLGANQGDLFKGLEVFSGSRRRFEHKGTVHDIEVIDDYGHHPTEIRVTLETAKSYISPGRVIVIFQPHRFSRTEAFAEEFGKALSLADQVFLLEVYPAGEKPIPGVTSALITKSTEVKTISLEPSMVKVIEKVIDIAKSGDLIMTLGAGDVNSLAPVIVQALEERYA